MLSAPIRDHVTPEKETRPSCSLTKSTSPCCSFRHCFSSGRKCVYLLLAALLAPAVTSPAAQARLDKMAIACSMYVSPCHCGLCPMIVDCAKKLSAECFCGTASPGTYPHPHDTSRFWMCSFDAQAKVPYGVELSCPARLVFDPVVKVCTVPSAVSSQKATPASTPSNTAAAQPPQLPLHSSIKNNTTPSGGSSSSATKTGKDSRPVAQGLGRASAQSGFKATAGLLNPGSIKVNSGSKP